MLTVFFAILLATVFATAEANADADAANAEQAVPLEDFFRQDRFGSMKISPTGEYIAATVPLEDDRTVLVVLERATMQQIGHFAAVGKVHVSEFEWVTDERIVLSVGEKFGGLDTPLPTGEIYATNADGSRQALLVGFRASGGGLGTRIKSKKPEMVFATLIDSLPDTEREVLISVYPAWQSATDPYTTAERLQIHSGRRIPVARAPVQRAQFTTDQQGEVRFAAGAGSDNSPKLYYREGAGKDWQLINDEAASGVTVSAIGFSADNRIAYLLAERREGPSAIESFDPATGERRQLLVDDNRDPIQILYAADNRTPIGAVFMDPTPRLEFFDAEHPDAKLMKTLQASFNGEFVGIDSSTRDGNLALLRTFSGSSPGDFYLFDREAKRAEHLIGRRQWIDPARMGEVRAFELKARDGLSLHGYLTLPPGGADTNLPLVVHPHGGPFGIQDIWRFNPDVQSLATRGYAVMQLNFRGSGGFGRGFQRAGYRQWGRAMQDDITDATRWAIEQGIADPDRICIYGASYGAYASLMGVAKEPDLYRCAVGYVGVYDLEMMYSEGDIPQRFSGENYLRDALGQDGLRETSPVNLAGRIKAPVFLAAGGEDQRTPLKQTEAMERALKAAGVPVETLVYPDEGHGFYVPAHQIEFQTRLLAFLDRHIGKDAAEDETESDQGVDVVAGE